MLRIEVASVVRFAVLLSSLGLGGCMASNGTNALARPEEPGDGGLRQRESALVDALWAYHEAAIREVLQGVRDGKFRVYGPGTVEFENALNFFEVVTQIESETASTHGRAITPELEEDRKSVV